MNPILIIAITFALGAILGGAVVMLAWITATECAILDKIARGGYREDELRRSRRAQIHSQPAFEEAATKVRAPGDARIMAKR